MTRDVVAVSADAPLSDTSDLIVRPWRPLHHFLLAILLEELAGSLVGRALIHLRARRTCVYNAPSVMKPIAAQGADCMGYRCSVLSRRTLRCPGVRCTPRCTPEVGSVS